MGTVTKRFDVSQFYFLTVDMEPFDVERNATYGLSGAQPWAPAELSASARKSKTKNGRLASLASYPWISVDVLETSSKSRLRLNTSDCITVSNVLFLFCFTNSCNAWSVNLTGNYIFSEFYTTPYLRSTPIFILRYNGRNGL